MALLTKAKPKHDTSTSTSTSTSTNTNMGLLLVFFPEDNSAIADKSKLFPSSSSSSSRSPFRRTNSSFLLSKAQSTILICSLFLFITLLLFTLSTFEPSLPSITTSSSRRFLSQKPPIIHIPRNPSLKPKTRNWWKPKSYEASSSSNTESYPSSALQRMGTLYRRGSRAMSDLVVGHVADDTSDDEFRLFLRVLHRSGLTAKSDVVLVFASGSLSSRFASIIQQEDDSFSSLIRYYYTESMNSTDPNRKKTRSDFDPARFFKKKGTQTEEPLWGKKSKSNNLTKTEEEDDDGESTQLSFGSVLSFDASELDPENSLAGFLDNVPMKLRRWACYPMLLGRVRRNFKHVILVDVKNLVLTNDPMTRLRNQSPDSVFLYSKSENGKHSKKNSDKTRRVNSGFIMGGARGVRRLSNSMLIEIVRAAMQHKKKNSVSESDVLSRLASNEFVLKNVNLITLTESIADASSLGGRNSSLISDYPIIQRGTSNYELNYVIKKHLCSSDVDSSVYRDC